MPLFIGLMSGTSMDGIDGVVLDLDPAAQYKVCGHVHIPFEPTLRAMLFDLNRSGPNEIHRAALASNALARAYAEVVAELCRRFSMSPAHISAIGGHGQTVRHQPAEHDGTGYTTQLLSGALLAELTGIDVVCDFRSRDVAAGGQGAPLVPAFHRAAFGLQGQDIAIVNFGGIANITFLYGNGQTAGHDCGPGNVLLDAWCAIHTGEAFDRDGHWAAQGQTQPTLLNHLLREPYLQRPAPKSTGRDLFNLAWLQQCLQSLPDRPSNFLPEDVQATLTEFTALTVANDALQHMPSASKLLVCGGGAMNGTLMARVAANLPATEVLPVQAASEIDPMQVEAAAFAWLAWAHKARHPGNCTDVTGARGPRILGAMYPA